MPLRSVEQFVDEAGDTWELERRDFGDGDVDYHLTTPDGRRRKVKRRLVR